jgi:hypothetical protein
MRREKSIWATTAIMGAAVALPGGWAFFWPRSFYDDFPIPGAAWVSTLGPFDEHLMTDFGSAQIGLALIVLVAVGRRSMEALRIAMIGYVGFSVLHFAYHLGSFEAFSTASALTQATALLTLVMVPGLVLYATRAKGEES